MLVLLLLMALLAGGAVVVGMQVQSTRGTDLTRNGLDSFYCAESGLAAVRSVIANNYPQWNASLCSGACVVGTAASEPVWLRSPAVSHDLDGDGADDFVITLKDNDDEQTPLANDPTRDNDLQVFIVSTCTKFPELPKQVTELVLVTGAGTCYGGVSGGWNGNGNSNGGCN